MQTNHQPTKEEIREWLAEQVESKNPIPEPEVIRERLWHIPTPTRGQVLT